MRCVSVTSLSNDCDGNNGNIGDNSDVSAMHTPVRLSGLGFMYCDLRLLVNNMYTWLWYKVHAVLTCTA